MTFQELKQNILNGTISDELIIFVSPENNFLVDAYINEMCALTNKNKKLYYFVNRHHRIGSCACYELC